MCDFAVLAVSAATAPLWVVELKSGAAYADEAIEQLSEGSGCHTSATDKMGSTHVRRSAGTLPRGTVPNRGLAPPLGLYLVAAHP